MEQQQSQRAFEAELNDEAFSFEIPEEEAFDWNDDLYEEAFDAVIGQDIYTIIPFYRDRIFEKIINNLCLFNEAFETLQVINLKKSFYNAHNDILKRRDMNGELVGQDLKAWEYKLNEYITESESLLSITSLDADQG